MKYLLVILLFVVALPIWCMESDKHQEISPISAILENEFKEEDMIALPSTVTNLTIGRNEDIWFLCLPEANYKKDNVKISNQYAQHNLFQYLLKKNPLEKKFLLK